LAKHLKLKEKEDQSVDTSFLLRRGKELSMKELQRQSLELRWKEGLSSDCPTWGSIPYTTTKPRHYCICQKGFTDRTLI
jgi:hypothetical protein